MTGVAVGAGVADGYVVGTGVGGGVAVVTCSAVHVPESGPVDCVNVVPTTFPALATRVYIPGTAAAPALQASGTRVGVALGIGVAVGRVVGVVLGRAVGVALGWVVGEPDGLLVGEPLGATVGLEPPVDSGNGTVAPPPCSETGLLEQPTASEIETSEAAAGQRRFGHIVNSLINRRSRYR